MKKVVFNEDNLMDYDIDKVTNKVRAIVFNQQGQALIVHYAGLYMLPGGSVEQNESKEEALKRELLEESGIEIDEQQARLFLEIISYDKNYFDRKAGTINRKTQTSFFAVNTNQEIDNSKVNLTESEKNSEFSLKFTNLSIIRYLVETNPTDNPKRKQFDKEILSALDEYQKLQARKSENSIEER